MCRRCSSIPPPPTRPQCRNYLHTFGESEIGVHVHLVNVTLCQSNQPMEYSFTFPAVNKANHSTQQPSAWQGLRAAKTGGWEGVGEKLFGNGDLAR